MHRISTDALIKLSSNRKVYTDISIMSAADMEMLSYVLLPEPLFGLLKGLEKKAVTNFYGAPGTGKTNISLISSISVAKNGGKVIYIDTEGGFSPERFKQIAHNDMSYLNNITILEPRTFQEQGKIIREVQDIEADLIVLDSAVSLYRLENTDPKIEKLETSRELSKQLSILSNIARDKEIPILITTHTFKNWDTGEDDTVGGDSIKYWSKSMVFIEKTSKTGERKATVTKHRSIEEGKSVKFQLVEDGIKPGKFSIF